MRRPSPTPLLQPPTQADEAGTGGKIRGRKQSPKYQNQRCHPSKESQTHTQPSRSVQRVWHHSRHRREDNHRAWAGRNSFSFPLSVYTLAPRWSFGAVLSFRQDPQEGVPLLQSGGSSSLPCSLLSDPTGFLLHTVPPSVLPQGLCTCSVLSLSHSPRTLWVSGSLTSFWMPLRPPPQRGS